MHTDAKAELGGKIIWVDLSKSGAMERLEMVILHEIVHLMGYGEAHAYGAMVAAGYWSKEDLLQHIYEWNRVLLSTKSSEQEREYVAQLLQEHGGLIRSFLITRKIEFEELYERMMTIGEQVLRRGK